MGLSGGRWGLLGPAKQRQEVWGHGAELEGGGSLVSLPGRPLPVLLAVAADLPGIPIGLLHGVAHGLQARWTAAHGERLKHGGLLVRRVDALPRSGVPAVDAPSRHSLLLGVGGVRVPPRSSPPARSAAASSPFAPASDASVLRVVQSASVAPLVPSAATAPIGALSFPSSASRHV